MKKDCPKRKKVDKKQEDGDCMNFVNRGSVSVNVNVLVVNTIKHSNMCIFIGYPEGGKGWKLWCEDGKTSKCFINRNVFLKENKYYMDAVNQLVVKASM